MFFLLVCWGCLLDSFWRSGCSRPRQGSWGVGGIHGLGKMCRWRHFWLPEEYFWQQPPQRMTQRGLGARSSMTKSLGWLKPMFLWVYRDIMFFMKLRMIFHQAGSDGLHKASQKKYLPWRSEQTWKRHFLKSVQHYVQESLGHWRKAGFSP